MASDDDEDGVVVLLRAVAHPIRLSMLRRLAVAPETCACDFTEVFGVSQPTVSQHLKVLREANLVSTRRDGVNICYSVRPDTVARLTAAVAGLQPAVVAATA